MKRPALQEIRDKEEAALAGFICAFVLFALVCLSLTLWGCIKDQKPLEPPACIKP